MHEYLSHLAEVNDIQPVIALKDTRSDLGAILLKKDSPIDQASNEKLEFAYRELEDALLMTEGFKFHIQRYRRQLPLYLAQPEPDSMHDYVKQLQSKLDAIPQGEKHKSS